MLYLKLFIKKNALFLLYGLYVTFVIYFGYFFDMNDFFNNQNQVDNIKSKTINNPKNIKKEIPFYDTNNPITASIIVFLIQLACIYFK